MSLAFVVSEGSGFYLIQERRAVRFSLLGVTSRASKFRVEDNMKPDKEMDEIILYEEMFIVNNLPETYFIPKKGGLGLNGGKKTVRVIFSAPRDIQIYRSALEDRLNLSEKYGFKNKLK